LSSTPSILVTGAAGAIGRIVCRALLDAGHRVTGFDRHPHPELEHQVLGELEHADPVWRAVRGHDCVIHLGACPNDASFLQTLLPSNIVGAWHVAEASAALGVRRLILASSIQVGVNLRSPGTHLHRVDEPPSPHSAYALTKCFIEDLGELFARRHKLSVLSARIGWLPRKAHQLEGKTHRPENRDLYFSHDDAARFFTAAAEAARPRAGEHAIVFAASRPVAVPRLDLEPARRLLGYAPRDTWPHGCRFQ